MCFMCTVDAQQPWQLPQRSQKEAPKEQKGHCYAGIRARLCLQGHNPVLSIKQGQRGQVPLALRGPVLIVRCWF